MMFDCRCLVFLFSGGGRRLLNGLLVAGRCWWLFVKSECLPLSYSQSCPRQASHVPSLLSALFGKPGSPYLTIHKVFGWLGAKITLKCSSLGAKPSEYFMNGQVEQCKYRYCTVIGSNRTCEQVKRDSGLLQILKQ